MVDTARPDVAGRNALYETTTLGDKPVSRTLDILKIAPTPFFSDYGCHVRILEETMALLKWGIRVHICTYRAGRDIAGIDIRRALGMPWGNGVKVGSSKRKIIFDAWLALRSLSVSLQVKPDIVHAHLHEGALIGLPLSRLWRVPLIFDFQGSLTSEMLDHNFLHRASLLYGPLRYLETIIDHKATAIITSSRNAADVLIGEFGCDPDKIFPVPDGVDPDRFRPKWEVGDEQKVALRRELNIPPDRKVVVFLGLLAEYQGISYLLRAASIICGRRPDVHFLLMGYPGQLRYLNLARSLGIEDHVTLPGRICYELAPLYLSLGDVAVSPKVSETEGNGKLLNYMAAGLPTVTFKTPVSREILGDLGVYAELGDSVDLANCLDELLTDEEGATELGRALRGRVLKHFVWKHAVRQILEIYENVANA
ncbi:MAG: glycosyltransferase family 4 protein [Chloroflexi bacterium]|nr:glycosyltransferase family 4 protein [Chloroflexota bacterium]